MSPWNAEQWISNNWRSPYLIVCLFIKAAYRITKLCRNIQLLDLRLSLQIGPPFYPKSIKIITQKENTISMWTSVSCISPSFLSPSLHPSLPPFGLQLFGCVGSSVCMWRLGGPLACMQFRYKQSKGEWVGPADFSSLTWLPPWPS